MLPKERSYAQRFAMAGAYFDVGNVVFYGYPQDGIRTLGARIARVHLKDFELDRPNGRFAWKNLGEGDVDWPAVSAALADVGYRGYVTTEVSGGDAAYLRDLAGRIDRLLRPSLADRGGNLGVAIGRSVSATGYAGADGTVDGEEASGGVPPRGRKNTRNSTATTAAAAAGISQIVCQSCPPPATV